MAGELQGICNLRGFPTAERPGRWDAGEGAFLAAAAMELSPGLLLLDAFCRAQTLVLPLPFRLPRASGCASSTVVAEAHGGPLPGKSVLGVLVSTGIPERGVRGWGRVQMGLGLLSLSCLPNSPGLLLWGLTCVCASLCTHICVYMCALYSCVQVFLPMCICMSSSMLLCTCTSACACVSTHLWVQTHAIVLGDRASHTLAGGGTH